MMQDMSKGYELGNMGIGALKSHASGAKHKLNSRQESVIPFSIIIAFVFACASKTRACMHA